MRTPVAISRTLRLLGATAGARPAGRARAAADAPVHAALRADGARRHRRGGQHAPDAARRPTAGCSDAQSGIGGTLNNNSWTMAPVNVAGGTVNSSSATVTIPAGATVLWAGLYWGADTNAGTNGAAAPNAAAKGTVRLKVGSGAYQALTANAADVLTSTSQATRYRAFKDVTALVAARHQHLLGRRRPVRHRPGPLRRVGPARRLPRQQPADPAPERLRRARHGPEQRAVLDARSRPSTRPPPAR